MSCIVHEAATGSEPGALHFAALLVLGIQSGTSISDDEQRSIPAKLLWGPQLDQYVSLSCGLTSISDPCSPTRGRSIVFTANAMPSRNLQAS